IQQPLVATNRSGQYDVTCTVSGGGLSGQAGAVRHGLSKALMNFEPDLRGALKKGGFLTRDPRLVERKKYGRAKATRSFQLPNPGGRGPADRRADLMLRCVVLLVQASRAECSFRIVSKTERGMRCLSAWLIGLLLLAGEAAAEAPFFAPRPNI